MICPICHQENCTRGGEEFISNIGEAKPNGYIGKFLGYEKYKPQTMKPKPNLQKLLTTWKFSYINSDITPDNFPLTPRKHGGYKLFHFDKYISTEDATKEMEKEGYAPATLLELLQWKDWNGSDWVVALGSATRIDGSLSVPSLDEFGSERGLRLDRSAVVWRAICRFLAVRTLDSHSSAPALGPLDTGTLPEILEINGITYKRHV